jgi:2-octaprenyl-6-methoxyphenol hydroxylase
MNAPRRSATRAGGSSRALAPGRRSQPQAQPIRAIHVSDAGRFAFARLSAQEQGVEAFGYVVANRCIGAGLWEHLTATPDLTLRVPARLGGIEITPEGVRLDADAHRCQEEREERIESALRGGSRWRAVAGAHRGGHRRARRGLRPARARGRASRRIAPHEGRAYERFTAGRPARGVAAARWRLRPLVWVGKPGARAGASRTCPTTRISPRCSACSAGARDALCALVAARSYDLALTRAVASIGERSVLIGNAAQALHPVAGQGFNLGLRDAARCLRS